MSLFDFMDALQNEQPSDKKTATKVYIKREKPVPSSLRKEIKKKNIPSKTKKIKKSQKSTSSVLCTL